MTQDPRREDMWNSFAHITACAGGLQRHHKFITKMSEAAPESLPLWMLHGHYHAMNGHGDEALHEYRRAWLARPSDPLLPLCIAATLLQHAISRKVTQHCLQPSLDELTSERRRVEPEPRRTQCGWCFDRQVNAQSYCVPSHAPIRSHFSPPGCRSQAKEPLTFLTGACCTARTPSTALRITHYAPGTPTADSLPRTVSLWLACAACSLAATIQYHDVEACSRRRSAGTSGLLRWRRVVQSSSLSVPRATLQVANREKAILQSLAFLKEYEAKRNFPHEAAYNMGRACHQLGLNYLVRVPLRGSLDGALVGLEARARDTHRA